MEKKKKKKKRKKKKKKKKNFDVVGCRQRFQLLLR